MSHLLSQIQTALSNDELLHFSQLWEMHRWSHRCYSNPPTPLSTMTTSLINFIKSCSSRKQKSSPSLPSSLKDNSCTWVDDHDVLLNEIIDQMFICDIELEVNIPKSHWWLDWSTITKEFIDELSSQWAATSSNALVNAWSSIWWCPEWSSTSIMYSVYFGWLSNFDWIWPCTTLQEIEIPEVMQARNQLMRSSVLTHLSLSRKQLQSIAHHRMSLDVHWEFELSRDADLRWS